MRLPEPSFRHVRRLTDDTGIFEHAWNVLPRRDCGYTVDDTARALLVACREPRGRERLTGIAGTYLAFLWHARRDDGRFHGRLSYAREWIDEVGSEDSHGRALWALGTAGRGGPAIWIRRAAWEMFDLSLELDSPHSRSNAFAVLGLAERLAVEPGHGPSRALLERCAERIPAPRAAADWPWPAPRLTYDNARIPQALMLAGRLLGEPAREAAGVRLLEWLVEVETRDDHFSFAPVGGWAAGEPRPGFDQQPVEAAAMADACATAWELTGEARWAERVQRAARWFVGANDRRQSLFDPETGGSRDGLEANGMNRNQGAESTLACVAALQQARRLGRVLDGGEPEGPQEVALVDGRGPDGAVGGPVG